MPRGPLPTANHRHRNAPTIPTTNLPAGGYTGPVPALPPGTKLGRAGRAWWKWAWTTPQAAAWHVGHSVTVARRASLEDDLAALGAPLDEAVVRARLAVSKEMASLEDRLGLSPKSMAQLRWSIVADEDMAGSAADVDNVVKPDRWLNSVSG